MIGEVIGHIKENSGNEYLVFDSSDENKEVLKNYKELPDGIKNKIEDINDGECNFFQWKYGRGFTKFKFDTDDDLPLNEPLKLHLLTIIVRCIFEEDSKFLSSSLFRWKFARVINARIR